MSEKLGPVTFGKKGEEIFLAREISQHRDYSEKTAQIIDEEVTKIVFGAAKKAESILAKHLTQLHALSEALLHHEVLDGAQIDQILNGKKLPPNNAKKKF